jgi:hypothetical protein
MQAVAEAVLTTVLLLVAQVVEERQDLQVQQILVVAEAVLATLEVITLVQAVQEL